MIKAIILAAGKGTRMGDLTREIPKPMVLVQGKPVLEWIIEGLRRHGGIKEIFIVVGYHGSVIRDYFGSGSKWDVTIAYGEQTEQNGTGKAPEPARDWAGSDSFVLTYGDILIDPTDYRYLIDERRGDGVIAVKAGEDLTKGGAVLLDGEDWMIDLIEKGALDAIPSNAYYNAGIYILNPGLFTYTAKLKKSPRGEYELTDALKAMARDGVKIKGVRLRKRWVDVRDPGVLAALNEPVNASRKVR